MKKRLHDLLINKEVCIIEAMRIMDKTTHKILFVIDQDKKLLGSITDGDIRRWILKEGDLNETVAHIYNDQPLMFYKDYNIDDIKKAMIKTKIQWIPIVTKNKVIVYPFMGRSICRKVY